MKRINVVKKSYDFDQIIQNGKCVKNQSFVIYYANNNLVRYRIGISVGKKIGNAVVRNYYKRILRNICDNHKNLYSNGRDYIIIIRKGCLTKSFSLIEADLVCLMNKLEKECKNEKKY